MKKILLSAALTAAMFTGCGGVDKQRLAQLTGDKSFEQVKESYKKAVFYEKNDDLEIYKYYLNKNADKVAGFDFAMYSQKVQGDYQKMKTEVDEKLKKMRDNLPKITISQLKNEMQIHAFLAGSAKPVDDYIKGVERLIKDKWVLLDDEKKAEKKKREAEYKRQVQSGEIIEKATIR